MAPSTKFVGVLSVRTSTNVMLDGGLGLVEVFEGPVLSAKTRPELYKLGTGWNYFSDLV